MHTDTFMELPPTGRPIDFVGVEIYRSYEDGIAGLWISNMWLET